MWRDWHARGNGPICNDVSLPAARQNCGATVAGTRDQPNQTIEIQAS